MKQNKLFVDDSELDAPGKIRDISNLNLRDVTNGEKGKEENIKIYIVRPILEELGYDRPGSADFEFKSGVGRADVALLIKKQPKVIIEIKSWEENLDNHTEQGIKYAIDKQVPFVLLTNGEEFRLYKSFIENIVKARDRELLRFKRVELIRRYGEIYNWISRESLSRKKTDSLADKKSQILRAEITPKTLVDNLRGGQNRLATDLIQKIEGAYYKDSKFKEKVDKWIDESSLSKKKTNEWVDRLSKEMSYFLINRLYFCRIAEDKGIIKSKLTKDKFYELKKSLSTIAILKASFEEITAIDYEAIFKDPLFSEFWEFDEAILDVIIQQLADYNFKMINNDILGKVYEMHISREERKRLGQFYTPQFIIDFISSQIPWNKETKVMDPASGSGGFLLAAYDKIRAKYDEDEQWVHEHILKQNIFGIDINPFAVQLSAMNLALRDMSAKTNHITVVHKDSLSFDLYSFSGNVNSASGATASLDVNMIFPERYDVIMGNPPYHNIKSDFVKKKYVYNNKLLSKVLSGKVNIASLFVAQFLPKVEKGGYFAFVLPKSLTYIDDENWSATRKLILDLGKVIGILDARQAFEEVLLEEVAIIVKRIDDEEKTQKVSEIKVFFPDASEPGKVKSEKIPYHFLTDKMFPLYRFGTAEEIYQKCMTDSFLLGRSSKVTRGPYIQKYSNSFSDTPTDEDMLEIVLGKDIKRFYAEGSKFINPNAPFLSEFKAKLDIIGRDRIICQRIVAQTGNHLKIIGTMDNGKRLTADTVINIIPIETADKEEDLRGEGVYFLTGLINSKFASYFMYNFVYNRAVRSMNLEYIRKLPIKRSKQIEKLIIDKTKSMLDLVSEMERLSKKIEHTEPLSVDYPILQKKYLDLKKMKGNLQNEIDSEVYRLYSLTETEIEEIESQV